MTLSRRANYVRSLIGRSAKICFLQRMLMLEDFLYMLTSGPSNLGVGWRQV